MSKLILALFFSAVFVGTVTAQPKDTIFYQDVSWSPDGATLLVSRMDISGDKYQYRIFSVDSSGKNYLQVTDGPGDVWTSWSNDGTRFVYGSKNNGNMDIYIKNIQTGESIKLTSDTARESHPDWSASNTQIAYITIDTAIEIQLVNPEDSSIITDFKIGQRLMTLEKKATAPQVAIRTKDGSPRIITNDFVKKGNPRWSPNGKQIAYYGRNEPWKDSIYIMNSDGTEKRALCIGVWPSWHPDGSKILFTYDDDIFQIDTNTKDAKSVIDNSFYARYSPDGKKIAFIRQTWKSEKGWPATSAVFIANADGTGEVRITPE
jgi:Tol biopolymer transport system component